MTTPTRADIIEIIRRDFPDEDAARVKALLDAYGIRDHERERERVHKAILALSDGDLDQVRENVVKAKRDYRDILVWGERNGPIYDVLSGKKTMAEMVADRKAGEYDDRSGRSCDHNC